MLGRAKPLWILGILSLVNGLICTVVILQFAEILPWIGDEGTHIGGRWTGVVTYAMAAVLAFAAAYGWLTIKSWSSMATIFAAGLGIFAPFISYMDGTDPRSSAIAPVLTSVLMLVLTFRSSTNRAMGAALANGKNGGKTKTPPPPKPMSAARKREVAEEQARAARQTGGAAPAVATASTGGSLASTGGSMANAAVNAAAATAAQAIAAMPKPAETAPVRPVIANMAKSAASALGVSSRTPAKAASPSAPVHRPAAPAPAAPPAPGQRPSGFRADEV